MITGPGQDSLSNCHKGLDEEMWPRLNRGDWIALVSWLVLYVVTFRTELKKKKKNKLNLYKIDEMEQLTVGCMVLEEEEGCTSPG